jgi:hypothetical protein
VGSSVEKEEKEFIADYRYGICIIVEKFGGIHPIKSQDAHARNIVSHHIQVHAITPRPLGFLR